MSDKTVGSYSGPRKGPEGPIGPGADGAGGGPSPGGSADVRAERGRRKAPAGPGGSSGPQHIDLSQVEPALPSTRARGSLTPGAGLPLAQPAHQHGGQLVLPAVAQGVPMSRQLVREMCQLLGFYEVADVAELLASEVVTNAVVHARTECVQVRVDVTKDALVVSVADGDNQQPKLCEPDADALGGRGLVLLKALAQDWGVTQWPEGKTVWFTLTTSGSHGTLAAAGSQAHGSQQRRTA